MTPATPIQWKYLPNAYDRKPWSENKGLLKLVFFTSILYTGQFLNGYEGTIIGNLQALTYWNEDLGNPDANKIGLLNAAAYIVGVCMGPINSFVADRFGRKWPIRWYSVTMLLGTILGCVAGQVQGNVGYGLFVASRAVIGSGIPPFMMSAMIMVQEIMHPRWRAEMAAFWDCCWVLGSTVASFTTFGTSHINSSWSWRIPYLLQLIPAIYMLVAVQFVPETPRFLIANGKEDQAKAFFVEYHGDGDPNDELVQFEWEEMKGTIALEEANKRHSWAEIWRMPGNKHRLGLAGLMTFMPQLNGGSIISFYYTVVLKQSGISGSAQLTGIGAGLNLFAFVTEILGTVALRAWRRRPMVLITWPILFVCIAIMAGTNGVFQVSGQTNRAAGIASVVMVWVFNGFNNFIGPLFYSYPAEVLNYSTRGKGMAVWNTVNQGWGAYGSYVNSIALAKIGWKYYCVFLPILAVQWLLAFFFMVETKGYTLEEIAIAFEGPATAVAQVDAHLQEDIEKGLGAGGPEDGKDVKDVSTVTVLSQ